MITRFKNKLTAYLEHLVERSLQKFLRRDFPYYINSASSTQATLTSIYNDYRMRVKEGRPLPDVHESGFSIYSQFDEDGIILYLFGVIGFKSRKFVDVGGGDGLFGNNTANLINNFGFHGLFIDYNPGGNKVGEDYYGSKLGTFLYPPKFILSQVTKDNINQTLKDNNYTGEIDFLSIDIDGNDYYVWEAIEAISPRIVVIETHVEFGLEPIVVPYDPNYLYPGTHPDYHGASPVAMQRLAKKKGYRLVATNRYGFNTFYVRNDIAQDLLPELPVEQVLRHDRNKDRVRLFEAIKHLPYNRID